MGVATMPLNAQHRHALLSMRLQILRVRMYDSQPGSREAHDLERRVFRVGAMLRRLEEAMQR